MQHDAHFVAWQQAYRDDGNQADTGEFEMRDCTRQEIEALEKLIDSAGLRGVLMALSEISDEKAEHIRTNWPEDKALARHWARVKGAIGLASCLIALDR